MKLKDAVMNALGDGCSDYRDRYRRIDLYDHETEHTYVGCWMGEHDQVGVVFLERNSKARTMTPPHVPSVGHDSRPSVETLKKGSMEVPVRTHVANWNLGVCKRCMKGGVEDGDIVVKIFGKGWWHDACFRAINPAFYAGM